MWKCGDVEMWKFRNVEMWRCGNVEMWKFRKERKEYRQVNRRGLW